MPRAPLALLLLLFAGCSAVRHESPVPGPCEAAADRAEAAAARAEHAATAAKNAADRAEAAADKGFFDPVFFVTVSFECPGCPLRPVLETRVSHSTVARLTKKNVRMLDTWVRAALAELKLPFREEVVDKSTQGRDLVEVDGVANTKAARWVLYLNGTRASNPYNRQLADGITSIRCVFRPVASEGSK